MEAHIELHLSEADVAAWIADAERIVLVGAAADAPETLLGYAMYETAATPETPVTERLGDVPAGHLSTLFVVGGERVEDDWVRLLTVA